MLAESSLIRPETHTLFSDWQPCENCCFGFPIRVGMWMHDWAANLTDAAEAAHQTDPNSMSNPWQPVEPVVDFHPWPSIQTHGQLPKKIRRGRKHRRMIILSNALCCQGQVDSLDWQV